MTLDSEIAFLNGDPWREKKWLNGSRGGGSETWNGQVWSAERWRRGHLEPRRRPAWWWRNFAVEFGATVAQRHLEALADRMIVSTCRR